MCISHQCLILNYRHASPNSSANHHQEAITFLIMLITQSASALNVNFIRSHAHSVLLWFYTKYYLLSHTFITRQISRVASWGFMWSEGRPAIDLPTFRLVDDCSLTWATPAKTQFLFTRPKSDCLYVLSIYFHVCYTSLHYRHFTRSVWTRQEEPC